MSYKKTLCNLTTLKLYNTTKTLKMILFKLFDLDFKYRKIIHYVLIAFVIFLQFVIIIVWYNEKQSNNLVVQNLQDMKYSDEIIKNVNNSNHLFAKSQNLFNNYINDNDGDALEKYKMTLAEMHKSLNKLALKTNSDSDFLKQGILEKEMLENDMMDLNLCIDSIINNEIIIPNNEDVSKIFSFNKFEFKNVLDSIKIDSYLKVDSIAKKGLFSRIGNALSGKLEIQKEQLNTTVIMKYKDKVTSGSIKDQIENVFTTTNKYYQNQFDHLKKRFSKFRNKDLELIEGNNELLTLSSKILPGYEKLANDLRDNTHEKFILQYQSNERVRNYTIIILIVLMLVISFVLLSFTYMAFEYERRLRSAQDKITENLNFKERIIGMISHEIRSPLTIMLIYIKSVATLIKDPEIKDTFKSIEFTTNSLLLLANQILEYSKDKANILRFKNKSFNLAQELDQIFSSMKSLVETKGNKMEVVFNLDSKYEVYSDAAKIHQVFYNIIGNANKFTKDGLICISIDQEIRSNYELNLKVKIEDNGIGISPDDLKNIFDSYYQGTVSEKVNNLGVGLGLNLCREIIDLFAGKIDVQSEVGKGTIISFNLILPYE
jgi:two-component system sensor histidine kinase BarA